MTAIIILLAAVVVLLVCAVWLLWRLTERLPARYAAESAPEQTADGKVSAGSIDEGFENIMQYSVKGKTGFEPGGMKI
jgi:hypothetical protein